MHEVLVNHLGDLSLPRKSVVRLNDCPDTTIDVIMDVKQQYNHNNKNGFIFINQKFLIPLLIKSV